MNTIKVTSKSKELSARFNTKGGFFSVKKKPLRTSNRTNECLDIDVSLRSLNSDTIKYLFDLFRQISQERQEDQCVNVAWYYDFQNKDLLKTGKDYSNLINLPFDFKPMSYDTTF